MTSFLTDSSKLRFFCLHNFYLFLFSSRKFGWRNGAEKSARAPPPNRAQLIENYQNKLSQFWFVRRALRTKINISHQIMKCSSLKIQQGKWRYKSSKWVKRPNGRKGRTFGARIALFWWKIKVIFCARQKCRFVFCWQWWFYFKVQVRKASLFKLFTRYLTVVLPSKWFFQSFQALTFLTSVILHHISALTVSKLHISVFKWVADLKDFKIYILWLSRRSLWTILKPWN